MMLALVRFGSKADIAACLSDVRFTSKTLRPSVQPDCCNSRMNAAMVPALPDCLSHIALAGRCVDSALVVARAPERQHRRAPKYPDDPAPPHPLPQIHGFKLPRCRGGTLAPPMSALGQKRKADIH